MPKLLIILSMLFMNAVSQSEELDLTEIREGYFHSSFGKDKIAGFNEQLLKIEKRTAIVVAYDAATKAILTRTTWNWFKKLEYLDESRMLFEQAVKMDSTDVEIRFLRFTVEDRIPFYLGYSDHMEFDKSVILKNIDNYDVENINPEILQFLQMRLKESGEFSEEELKMLSRKLNNLK